MNQAALTTRVGAWPGVAHSVKWQDDLVFTVADKMFCVLCLRGAQAGSMSFKVAAPYLARAHWVQVAAPAQLPSAELQALLRRSYELVCAKLPKKTQRALADD